MPKFLNSGIARWRDVTDALDASKSTVYGLIRRGLFPPPVALGPRMRGWPVSEVDALIAARTRGADDDELRRIVEQLLLQRRESRKPSSSTATISDAVWLTLTRLAAQRDERRDVHLQDKQEKLQRIGRLLGEIADSGETSIAELAALTNLTPTLVATLIEKSETWSLAQDCGVSSESLEEVLSIEVPQ